jgi:hypothetical protein
LQGSLSFLFSFGFFICQFLLCIYFVFDVLSIYLSVYVSYNLAKCVQLAGMMWDPELSFALKPKMNKELMHGSESDEPSTPKKMRRGVELLDEETSQNGRERMSPGTPPNVNHRISRRKGIPHRAPPF